MSEDHMASVAQSAAACPSDCAATPVHSQPEARLRLIVQSFIATQNITCSETIYQTDRVIENASEFIERLCDEVGYAEWGAS